MALQPPRGTRDLLPEHQRLHRHIADTARRIAALYGFAEWATPIFEDTSVFARTLGETSDVVSKEMYTFPDRGGDSLTLRPEGTAGICRALISGGLTQTLPQRAFYAGPMFRYERPQKGRYRQFHQIGCELIGPAEPLADAEIIALGHHILTELGLAATLELNTLGDTASRDAWRARLVTYLSAHRTALSPDSQARLDRNPLRILDSKHPSDRALLADAPRMVLSDEAARFWSDLRRHLDAFAVPYTENPDIVRGLDYYSHTAFEFTSADLGAQSTVLAGGRYNSLIAELGGPQIAAIGWAAGIDRLALLIAPPPAPPPPVAIIPATPQAEPQAITALQSLRRAGLAAEIAYRGTLKTRLARADKSGATHALLLDATAPPVLKNLTTGAQSAIALPDLAAHLRSARY